MGKDFKQHITDLESGLATIKRFLTDPKTNTSKRKRALENLEIQQARIEFFKKGYNLCKKEIESQEMLS